MHQCTKEEPNRFTDGTVIGTDVCTHSPPTQTIFTTNLCIFYLYIYIPKSLYMGQMKIYKLTDIPLCTQMH